MFGTPIESSDIVASSYAAATIASFAAAVLTMLGLSWTAERWRVAVALSGVVLLASAFAYLEASQVWLATHRSSAAFRYIAWFTVQPMQVATAYFFTRACKPAPTGVFWRMTVAAILMVLSRYLGDGGFFNPTLGVLLSIAFWLYILGEMYFGPMGNVMAAAPPTIWLGYFWIRLILTIGWAIYPILYFVDLVIGVGYSPAVIILYTLADVVNLIAMSLIVLAVASQERY